MQLKVPFFSQCKDHTCGAACLKMVMAFWGVKRSETLLARDTRATKAVGATHQGMISAARKQGFSVHTREHSSLHDLRRFLNQGLATIVHFIEPSDNETAGHYAVVTGMTREKIIFNDPWNGSRFSLRHKNFKKRWYASQGRYRYRRWLIVLKKTG